MHRDIITVTIQYGKNKKKQVFMIQSPVQHAIDHAKFLWNIKMTENVVPFHNGKEINYTEKFGNLGDLEPVIEIRNVAFDKMTGGIHKGDESAMVIGSDKKLVTKAEAKKFRLK